MMCLRSLFIRASFKFRIFATLCLCLSFYVFIFNKSSIFHKLKAQLLFISNLNNPNDIYQHKFGQLVESSNGSLLYFHLPSLKDYSVEKDYFELNSIEFSDNNKPSKKYCLKDGADINEIQSENLFYCICKQNYTGPRCSIPFNIKSVLDVQKNIQLYHLQRPRRILISLICFFNYSDNYTINEFKIKEFHDKFAAIAEFADLFVIHEIQLATTNSENKNLLRRHFTDGILKQFNQFTLIYNSSIDHNQATSINLNKFEFEKMRLSWDIFTSRVTEYRPEDILLFFSINNFPKRELLLFLKHHGGISDIFRLNPIFTWKFNSNFTLSQQKQSQKRNSKESSSVYHLQNLIVSFEYISFLCRYNFLNFVSHYCLNQKETVKRFQNNFWKIHAANINNSVEYFL